MELNSFTINDSTHRLHNYRFPIIKNCMVKNGFWNVVSHAHYTPMFILMQLKCNCCSMHQYKMAQTHFSIHSHIQQ